MDKKLSFQIPKNLLDKWDDSLRVKAEGNVIEILDVIGFDYLDGGITVKNIKEKLSAIGDNNEVTVVLNSPGGDMFEGIAIYNALKSHKGKVTIDVIGIAASAASVIAMAGDEIRIAKSAFFMIHNAWVVAAGNKNEFIELAEYLKPFDENMAQIYADKTSEDIAVITSMMDAETWLNGTKSVESGFADSILNETIEQEDTTESLAALRLVEAALRGFGYSRGETKNLLKEIKNGTPSAAKDTISSVNLEETAELTASLKTILRA